MLSAIGELMNAMGLSAIACTGLALLSFCMMVIGIVRDNQRRKESIRLLMAGILYAAVNITVLAVTLYLDSFAIFETAYIIAVAFVGPALMVAALVFFARARKRLRWLSTAGFTVWTVCIAFAHLWIIAAASASV